MESMWIPARKLVQAEFTSKAGASISSSRARLQASAGDAVSGEAERLRRDLHSARTALEHKAGGAEREVEQLAGVGQLIAGLDLRESEEHQ